MKPFVRKAVCLLSGGLDSTLAARMVIDQGIEVVALNFVTSFCTCTPKTAGCAAAAGAARQLGINVRTENTTREIIELVKDPPHGHGSNLNPCIDCRILIFRRALEYMREIGASFIITGEVLGERPMSQRRDAMRTIERASGAEGLVLRPLSAVLLEPSIPEREGWVDRSKLLSISGRSRKPQIALASEFGINDYPCPAGGCRLTDPGFAGRMLDLLEHADGVDVRDVNLLRHGRHFRLSPTAKAIVGRFEEENEHLLKAALPHETVIEPTVVPGPTTLVTGAAARDDIDLACRIAATYFKTEGGDVALNVTARGASAAHRARPVAKDVLDETRVAVLEPGWRKRALLPSLKS
jgi:tRNA U34 2-thiouridine synthase MnmA/TrmU